MKPLFISISSILLFTTASCLAIDQKLIDGATAYKTIRAEASRVFEVMKTSVMSLDESKELRHKVTNYDLPVEDRE